ncbi:MAG: hypothetical protein WCF53_17785, partial [Pseudolabrys sp.]
LDVVLGQDLESFGTDLQSLPNPFLEYNGPCTVLDQFLNVGGLNAGKVTCTRLTPIPFPCAAGKNLSILKGRMALDLYAAP